MGIFSSLTNKEKESIGILQVGTFLESFDLFLYIHLASIIDSCFLPPKDINSNIFFSPFAFCAAFLFRPLGALIFGWIGDHIGRKPTIVITMFLMSVSCIGIALLPSYAQGGILVAWIFVILRAIQGISSMAEIIGAEVYLTETLKSPIQYPIVAFVGVCASMGSFVALLVITLFTFFDIEKINLFSSFDIESWRMAFFAGFWIAIIGSFARTRLRETPNFVDMNYRLKKAQSRANKNEIDYIKKLSEQGSVIEKWDTIKSIIIYSVLLCAGPTCIYFVYVYSSKFLSTRFGLSFIDIIHQNLFVSFIQVIVLSIYSYISYWVYPMKILKFKIVLFSLIITICPFWLDVMQSPWEFFILQCLIVTFGPNASPAVPIFLSKFPILHRFSYGMWTYAWSRAFIYTALAFGVFYLDLWIGYKGWWFIFIPVTVAFAIGVRYFETMESMPKIPPENVAILAGG